MVDWYNIIVRAWVGLPYRRSELDYEVTVLSLAMGPVFLVFSISVQLLQSWQCRYVFNCGDISEFLEVALMILCLGWSSWMSCALVWCPKIWRLSCVRLSAGSARSMSFAVFVSWKLLLHGEVFLHPVLAQ